MLDHRANNKSGWSSTWIEHHQSDTSNIDIFVFETIEEILDEVIQNRVDMLGLIDNGEFNRRDDRWTNIRRRDLLLLSVIEKRFA